jgi:hypothetical protein
MTTQYTTILKLALPVQGELSGTWGDVVNDNITQMVEQAVAGKAVINTWTANSHTLTTADGTTSESRCAILELTDSGTALTGAGTVVCPTNTKLYIVDNNTLKLLQFKPLLVQALPCRLAKPCWSTAMALTSLKVLPTQIV